METVVLVDEEVPLGNLLGFKKFFKNDVLSGFLVFLIALPLCIGISLASGFPAFSGVITAIVGAVVASLLSNSELTIKGPAAGLIVIVYGAVTEFGYRGNGGPEDYQAYKMALAVGVVSGLIQIAFGYFKLGRLSEIFPSSVVHGMLASIGIIIIAKQLPIMFGQTAKGNPLELIASLPDKIMHANPEIAIIGICSLLLLVMLPRIQFFSSLRKIPAPLVVLMLGFFLAKFFDLTHAHTYSFSAKSYDLNEKFLVTVPQNILSAITTPDFTVLSSLAAWKWILMFCLIGSLESILSAKAIETLDPWKRKTDFNRDLLAIGIANTLAACLGGLPMISEIVRSKANIDNGARTRYANLWHGIFLLAFLTLVPNLIHQIPLAALAAMLVFTGFRLASPKEFAGVYRVGKEQLFVFCSTIIGVLSTDLLVGLFIGMFVEMLVAFRHGTGLKRLFVPKLTVDDSKPQAVTVKVEDAVVFSNWTPLRREIEQVCISQQIKMKIDFSEVKFIDHSAMSKIFEFKKELAEAEYDVAFNGMDKLRPFSSHPEAGRRAVRN